MENKKRRKSQQSQTAQSDEIIIKKSIRVKIMTITTVIVIGVMLVCTAILRYSMNSLTRSILLDVLQPMTKQSSKAIECNIHLMADRIITIASDNRLQKDETEEMVNVLKDARNNYEFYGIGIYDMEGNTIVTDGEIYNSLLEAEWFELLQSTDNLTVSDPIVTAKYVGIPMGMPIKTQEETIAYLVGIYKYDMLSEVLSAIHIGQTGMALLINENGKIVGHHLIDIVKQQLNIYDLDTNTSAHQIFDRMITRETGSMQGLVNGQQSYVSFCPVRGTRWSFAIEIPKKEYMKSTNIAILNTMVGTFAALIIALIVIYMTTTVISNQLKKVILRMNQFAQGDLKSEVEVKESKDEVEVLSISLKTTLEDIKGYLAEIQRVLDSISKGNLNVSTSGDYRGDFVVLKESLTQIITSLNQMMKQINDTVYELMGTAESMGSQSEELQQVVSRQTEAMSGLSSEVESIQDNLNNVTENTKATRQKALEIARQIAGGNEKMEALKAAMEAIDQNAKSINKITQMIEEISKQTNILSLNAALEASRAGEAGKGFSVVAQKVKGLAEQSSKAAKDTMDMIEKSYELIRKGVKLTIETSKSLEEISKGSDAVTEIASRLSETVEVQEVSLHKMTGKIEDVSAITDQNLQCAEKAAEVSDNLKVESDKLKDLLSGFQFH